MHPHLDLASSVRVLEIGLLCSCFQYLRFTLACGIDLDFKDFRILAVSASEVLSTVCKLFSFS